MRRSPRTALPQAHTHRPDRTKPAGHTPPGHATTLGGTTLDISAGGGLPFREADDLADDRSAG